MIKYFRKNKKELITFVKYFLVIFFLIYYFGMVYGSNKSLPPGTSFDGKEYLVNENSIEFLKDITYNENGTIKREHEIFDRVFEMINSSQEFILIDMFLMGDSRRGYRNLSLELKDNLINKKKENPNITINFITDEFNIDYYSYYSNELKEMQEFGINVIYTDMTKMRDSNPVYSSLYRIYFSFLDDSSFNCKKNVFFGEKEFCLDSVFRAANLKANHRKLIVADRNLGNEKIYATLIGSANPDDSGSGYSNSALYFEEGLYDDIYSAEKSVSLFSNGKFEEYSFSKLPKDKGDAKVKFITEGKIKENLISEIDLTESGEKIDIAMFLLTEQDIISSLISAANRGVEIEIVLDPSNNLFGQDSKGVPNCGSARDLVKRTNGKIKIRWYDTGDQQFHTKFVVIHKNNGRSIVFLGSANLTRRNINDLNLEADVKLDISSNSSVIKEIEEYFDLIWNGDEIYTVSYSSNSCSTFSYLKYRFQEATGLGLF